LSFFFVSLSEINQQNYFTMKTKLHILAVLIVIISTNFLFAQQENDFICGTVMGESDELLNFSPHISPIQSAYLLNTNNLKISHNENDTIHIVFYSD